MKRKRNPTPNNEIPPPTAAEVGRVRREVAENGGKAIPGAHVARIHHPSGVKLCGCGKEALVKVGGVRLCVVCDSMHSWPRYA